MRDAFARALGQAARTHPDIALVVADISPAASLKEFLDENPTRIVDVGVSEQAMIGMAAGMAIAGLRPFAYTMHRSRSSVRLNKFELILRTNSYPS